MIGLSNQCPDGSFVPSGWVKMQNSFVKWFEEKECLHLICVGYCERYNAKLAMTKDHTKKNMVAAFGGEKTGF